MLTEILMPPLLLGPRARPRGRSHPRVLALQQGQLALVEGGGDGVHDGQLRCGVRQGFQRFGWHPSTDGRVDSADGPQH